MDANIEQKVANKYVCEVCDYKTIRKSSIEKHYLSRKHFDRTQLNKKVATNKEENLLCKICNRTYKVRNSLWYHEQKCKKTDECNENNDTLDASSNEINMLTNMVLEIVKSNLEVVKSNTELQKQNQDLQKQMLDVCKNIQPTSITTTNSNNNNNNKTFNLQVFLNEECKDAMNLKDFVNSFKLQLSDLELVGDEGFINGMTKVILAKLNLLEENTRPFHCTDLKRETVYVKEDDVWVREGPDNAKLAAAIKAIGHQNFFILKEYKALHPDCESTYSEFNDHYMNLIMKSAGCQKEDIAKVIKKLVKEIVIRKS
jgi:hypothetical protein